MLNQLKNKILGIRKAAGIEVVVNNTVDYRINSIIASIEKGRIVKESIIPVNNYNKLSGFINKEIPVFLTINGKGVLTKQIPDSIQEDAVIETILPGANPKDFYSIQWKQESISFASLIRKEQANEILQQMHLHGYKVIGFSFGFSSVSTIMDFVNAEDTGEIQTSTYIIQFNQSKNITNFQTRQDELASNPEYSLADQYLRGNELLAFAGATALLADALSVPDAYKIDIITTNRKEYKYELMYRAALWGILSGVLLLLLVNFFFFNYYFEKNKLITASKTLSEHQLEKINGLKKNIEDKEQFLLQAGWMERSEMSLIADRIASLVPANTFLTSLVIHPSTIAAYGDPSEINFKKDTVIITGQSDNASEINQFVNNLKNIHFIKKVAVKNYIYKKDKETGTFIMEIVTGK